MPRTHRYPVFLWRSGKDAWAGRLLDDSWAIGTACGGSVNVVLRELKDCLHAADSADRYVPVPDFFEPEFRVVKVNAVPEYELKTPDSGTRKRTLPCAEPVNLKLPCVTGKRESGLVCALLPTLGEEFELGDGDKIEEMALHYARQALKSMTPADLLRLLPPAEWKLETISFTPRRKDESLVAEKLEHLPKVADHAGAPALRRTARTWERDAEVIELETRLRQPQGNVLLVGESGCGKTAVLIEAARRVEQASGEKGRKPRRFWITSGSRLIAGMRWLGQWQERLEEVIAEARGIEGVLCFENLQELMRLGGAKPESSLAAFLIPYLHSGELRVVVEATPAEVEACERTLPGFLDAFAMLKIEPLNAAQQDRVLQLAAQSISGGGVFDFPSEAALEAGRLCRRFRPYAGFPGAPLGLMHESAAKARDACARSTSTTEMRRLFADTTGLPEALLDEALALSPEVLLTWFQERLIAQPQAVAAICTTLLKFKAGLHDPKRPLAVLLFAGPTGTGKTQLTKCLGDWLFPHRKASERLVRLDMSEYAGHDAARRLLGEPFGEPSELVKRLRQNPFTVLLLDEVEKAAPEVFDTLMNVFDEGRLTDALGRVTWFRSAVIIMTSNLGTRKVGSLGFSSGGAQESAKSDLSAIRRFFRPEFFNRMDQVVTFEPLNRAAVETIAQHEVAALAEREGLKQRGITLDISADLLHQVCESGFDPVYGARPLQRRLEELVTTPVARWLVEHPAARDVVLRVAAEGVSC
jgi:ATP-dependent Clp protease ATP-binding subunit ClpC